MLYQLKQFGNFYGDQIHLHVVHKMLLNIFKSHEQKLYFFDVPLKGANENNAGQGRDQQVI